MRPRTGRSQASTKEAYWEVVDHCYLCDMCFMTKCPYVPPHPWNVDFPHLMLRAKAVRAREHGFSVRERMLAATDTVGTLAGIPVVAELVNAVKPQRRRAGAAGEDAGRRSQRAASHLSRAQRAPAPGTARHDRHGRPAAARLRSRRPATSGRVALFTTCYGNRNDPALAEDLVAVFEHNGIELALLPSEHCCGMPRLELGDLEAVAKLKEYNIPRLARAIAAGYDVVAPIPSCVLMFKQELPLMYPEDEQVRSVAQRMFDPFEYLMLRHAAGQLRTDFKTQLGTISYHVPCHLRVQNIGLKTRDVLRLVPGTTVEPIERCSGHNGTYGVKREFRAASVHIGRPVAQRVENAARRSLRQRLPHGRAADRERPERAARRRSTRCGCCASPMDCRAWRRARIPARRQR